MTAARAVLRRRVMPAMLISLAAGLALLVPAPHAALAASQGTASISAGFGYSCAIESGKAYCWGGNYVGQLGDGSTANSSVPVAVDTSGALAGKTLTQITGSAEATCALDSVGAAYCWGGNVHGDLGDGSMIDSSVAVAVDTSGVLAGKTLTHLTAGSFQTCALDSAGAAYCWGGNGSGQLGDGSTTDSSVPVAVDTSGTLAGKTLTQITTDFGTTCALDSAGAAYCWGSNGAGQVGDGSTTDSSVPVAVDTSGALAGKTLTHISVGVETTCAVDSADAAYCWGDNSNGQLGDGSTTDSSVPVAVDTSGALAGKTLTQIAAGWGATCVLDSTGAAYCWGLDANGQLGDGSTTDSSVPVAVDTSGALAGKTLTQIAAGQAATCVLDSAGAAYCWGWNGDGGLGDGSAAAQSTVPVLVGPQAPTSVTATPSDTTATVSWTVPASLDGGTLTGYTATASPGGTDCTTSGATTCTITGLTNGTTYSVSVVAHTTSGDSGASTPASVTPSGSAALPAPVTTVTSSRNPSTFGQHVTFTATVGPTDGGTMTFSNGPTALCSAVPLIQVSGSTYQATCTTTALPAGRDTITAAYPGDASYATSTGTLTQIITRAPTALTASIRLSPHQAITLTATLTASGRPLSGQPVSFSTRHTHLCIPDTSTRGVATCVLTGPQARQVERNHDTIRASYPGNTSYQPSSATTAPPWWW
jgi:alpha-tubulin suppressor-like RCC1 family protein